jgi:hypothetical protein
MGAEACELISNAPGRVGIASVVGPYRTGKSLLGNIIAGVRADADGTASVSFSGRIVATGAGTGGVSGGGGFVVSSRTKGQTKGLWILPYLVRVELADGTWLDVVLIDTEGLGDPESTPQKDMRIMLLAFCVSSLVIYNSLGAINEATLEQLNTITALSKNLRMEREALPNAPVVAAAAAAVASATTPETGGDSKTLVETATSEEEEEGGGGGGGGGGRPSSSSSSSRRGGRSGGGVGSSEIEASEEKRTPRQQKEFDDMCPVLLWAVRDFALQDDAAEGTEGDADNKEVAAGRDQASAAPPDPVVAAAQSDAYLDEALRDREPPPEPPALLRAAAAAKAAAAAVTATSTDTATTEVASSTSAPAPGAGEHLKRMRDEHRTRIEAVRSKNAIRRRIREYFPHRRCVRMRRAANTERELQQLGARGLAATRPEFREDVETLRHQLKHALHEKRLAGRAASGRAIVSFINTVINAINSGRVPVIRDAIAGAAIEQLVAAKYETLKHWDDRVRNFFRAQKTARLSVGDATPNGTSSSSSSSSALYLSASSKPPAPKKPTASAAGQRSSPTGGGGKPVAPKKPGAANANGVASNAPASKLKPPVDQKTRGPTATAKPTHVDDVKLAAFLQQLLRECKVKFESRLLTADDAGSRDALRAFLAGLDAQRKACVAENDRRRIAWVQETLVVQLEARFAELVAPMLVPPAPMSSPRLSPEEGEGAGDTETKESQPPVPAQQVPITVRFSEFAAEVDDGVQRGGAAVAALLQPRLGQEWACRYADALETRLAQQVLLSDEARQLLAQATEQLVEQQKAADEARQRLEAAEQQAQQLTHELESARQTASDRDDERQRWQAALQKATEHGVALKNQCDADLAQVRASESDACRARQEAVDALAGAAEAAATAADEYQQQRAHAHQQLTAAVARQTEAQHQAEQHQAAAEQQAKLVVEARTQLAAAKQQCQLAMRRAAADKKAGVEALQKQAVKNDADVKRAADAAAQHRQQLAAMRAEHDQQLGKSRAALVVEKQQAKKLAEQHLEARATHEATLDRERKTAREAQRQLQLATDALEEHKSLYAHEKALLEADVRSKTSELQQVRAVGETDREQLTIVTRDHRQCAAQIAAARKQTQEARQLAEQRDTEHAAATQLLQRRATQGDEQRRQLAAQHAALQQRATELQRRIAATKTAAANGEGDDGTGGDGTGGDGTGGDGIGDDMDDGVGGVGVGDDE